MGAMNRTVFDQVYTRVCHVKQGLEGRRAHIDREFSKRGVPVDFFLDHDIPDIDRAELAAVPIRPGEYSVALKHVGIWRAFLDTGKPYCLVFEDDVFLAPDFVHKLGLCLYELGDPARRAAVYLGNGCNLHIPASDIVPGQHLYRSNTSRCMDSYLITRPVAEARLDWLERNPLTLPIDHQVNVMDEELGIEVLWFEPTIVEQGSENGAFASSLRDSSRPGRFRKLIRRWKKAVMQLRGKGYTEA